MTQDHAVIVPLMIANLVSLFISRLQQEPIYEALAVHDGIHLPTGESRQPPESSRSIAPSDANHCLPTLRFKRLCNGVRATQIRSWLITDRRGVVELINLQALERAASEDDTKKLSTIANAIPSSRTSMLIGDWISRSTVNQVEILPVVSRADLHKLEGIVTLRDVLDSYGLSMPDRD